MMEDRHIFDEESQLIQGVPLQIAQICFRQKIVRPIDAGTSIWLSSIDLAKMKIVFAVANHLRIHLALKTCYQQAGLQFNGGFDVPEKLFQYERTASEYLAEEKK